MEPYRGTTARLGARGDRGRPLRRLVPAEGEHAFAQLWAVLQAGHSAPISDRVHLQRESRDPVLAHVAPLKDPDDRFAGVVFTLSPVEVLHSDLPTGDLGDHRDDVTGLPGRRWMQRRLGEPLRAGQRRGVAVLDVDAFALLNQDYGPDAADGVLRELGQRLAAVPGPGMVGRWQADEFVFVVDSEDPDAEEA